MGRPKGMTGEYTRKLDREKARFCVYECPWPTVPCKESACAAYKAKFGKGKSTDWLL